jgi:lambda repressor-like predicted transcriptional regulator
MNTPRDVANNTADVETADRILNALIVKGTNQKELAKGVGISYTTLRRSLHQERHDRRSLTIQELGNIATALGIQPSVLLPAKYTERSAA